MLRIETVAEIKARIDTGQSDRIIAKRTGVSRRTIALIRRGDRDLVGLSEVHLDDVPEIACYFRRAVNLYPE